jgi:hypothetical protein
MNINVNTFNSKIRDISLGKMGYYKSKIANLKVEY